MPSENIVSKGESYMYEPNLSPLPFKKGLKVQIQTTSKCNGKCIICPYLGSWHHHSPGYMSEEVFNRIVVSLKKKKISKICLYFQNEPLLDPQLIARIEKISTDLQFGYIEISTNASPLTKEYSAKLVHVLKNIQHEIWISFHGCDERTYSGMMGLDFHKALNNIIHLLKISQSTPLRIVIRGAGKGIAPNLRTIYDFSEHDFRLFWHQQFQINKIKKLPGLFYHPYNSRSDNIRRSELKQNHIIRQSLENFSCSRISDWLHFMYTGELVICCMDYQREEILGDIRGMDLEDILKSEQFLRLKRKVEGKMPSESNFICKRCTHPGD